MFPYGWPAQLQPPAGGAAAGPTILLRADQEFVVAVTPRGVAVWSGAAQRVRLGAVHLSDDDVQAFGTHVAACWCPERARLAVVVCGPGQRRTACRRGTHGMAHARACVAPAASRHASRQPTAPGAQ